MNRKLSWQELKKSLPHFLDTVFAETERLDLDVSFLDIDHAGLRFSNPEDVSRLKDEMVAEGGSVISNEIVNGREILIIKLSEPVGVGQFMFSCIELPYPAKHHTYPEDGWEHVEFVIPSPAKTVEEMEIEFLTYCPSFNNSNSDFAYKLDLPQVEGTIQPPNPTVALKLKPMLTIKFHPKSIEEIVS
jgi:uncharacterized protein